MFQSFISACRLKISVNRCFIAILSAISACHCFLGCPPCPLKPSVGIRIISWAKNQTDHTYSYLTHGRVRFHRDSTRAAVRPNSLNGSVHSVDLEGQPGIGAGPSAPRTGPAATLPDPVLSGPSLSPPPSQPSSSSALLFLSPTPPQPFLSSAFLLLNPSAPQSSSSSALLLLRPAPSQTSSSLALLCLGYQPNSHTPE